MIGTVQVKVQAAMPNHPLQPLFAFKGSPSSMRIMDVPKKIGEWEIKEVSVLVKYPDNTQAEKVAVRTGNVWIATVEGCETTGRVVKGYEVLASGIDENGNDVSGYVLGSGDVFILERDSSIPEKGVEKFYVKFCETLPANPQKGDIVDDGGTVKMYDGTKWIDMGGGSTEEIGDATLTIKKNGTNVGSFTANSFLNKTIDITVPTTTNELVNDSGYITAEAIPSEVSAFDNDVGYITASALPTKVSELENDSGYITENAIPSTVGAFQNDVGYLTSVSWGEVQDKPDVALMSDMPSKVSELDNDEGFITAEALPSKVSELQNDVGYITASAIPAIPSQTSDLENDSGFITASAIPSNVSAFNNDVGYLTASDVSTSALYPSASYSAYVQIDDYGEVNAKKQLNETGVWFVKAIMEPYTTNPVTGYWVSPPKITDDGTNLLVEFWVQDRERKYEPEKITYDAASSLATEILIAVAFHNVGFRVHLKKSTQADLPVWIDCGRLVRDGDANTGLRISQLEDDIGLVHDISEKRDLTDISYPASDDPTGMYTISKFTVDGVLYDAFGTGYPSTGDSYWTDDGEYHTNCVWTSDGTNYQLRLSDTDFGSTFTFSQLKAGSVEVTSSEVSHTVVATFKQTTFALKDYVDAKLSTKREENDMGYIWYDVSDSVYRGITRWKISGLKTSGGTVLPDFYTTSRNTGHPTYYTYWNNGQNVIWTRNGFIMIVSINNPAEPPAFNISGNNYGRNVFKVSYVDEFGVQQNLTLTADFQQEYFAFKSYVNDKATVSGIGCSTVTMSGVYADTTTFSYNVVVQPSS